MGTEVHSLVIRPLGPEDEAPFLAAHRDMAEQDGFVFGLGYVEGSPGPSTSSTATTSARPQ